MGCTGPQAAPADTTKSSPWLPMLHYPAANLPPLSKKSPVLSTHGLTLAPEQEVGEKAKNFQTPQESASAMHRRTTVLHPGTLVTLGPCPPLAPCPVIPRAASWPDCATNGHYLPTSPWTVPFVI